MSEKRFKKGDWTNCRYDICEIIDEDDEIICVVALNDADKIIKLLEENEQLRNENKTLRKTERSWRRIHCCNKESNNCGIVGNQESKIKLLEKENNDLRQQRDYYEKICTEEGLI